MFEPHYRALIIGASGSIGSAFVRALQADPLCAHVETLSRSQGSGFDLLDETSLERHALALKDAGPFHLVVDATGALTINAVGPEKSLAALSAERLMQSFQINAAGPALLLRHFAPLLAQGPSVYAKLSARVGSISDNQKGGWYGYRAAKAALNMLLQTAAVELQRKNPALRVMALQPGTVRSALSDPFAASVPNLLQADDSVAGLLQAMRQAQPKQGAHFVDWQGQEIPW